MLSDARIAISGKSGCGNSTVSRLVAQSLGLRLINYTFHDMAKEIGISFKQMCELAEQDALYDLRLDQKQLDFAVEPGCVLGSRLAIWLLKEADLKVYLAASLKVRAQRISEREGQSFKELFRETRERDKRDRGRYIKLYHIDIDECNFADLIIDTEHMSPFEIADQIIKEMKNRI
ncbi:MAG TPA: cytidylate kinase family protein [Spirochaetia bacterium]|nr:cytidylate kinase family protein [Spirochaetia bacterium]